MNIENFDDKLENFRKAKKEFEHKKAKILKDFQELEDTISSKHLSHFRDELNSVSRQKFLLGEMKCVWDLCFELSNDMNYIFKHIDGLIGEVQTACDKGRDVICKHDKDIRKMSDSVIVYNERCDKLTERINILDKSMYHIQQKLGNIQQQRDEDQKVQDIERNQSKAAFELVGIQVTNIKKRIDADIAVTNHVNTTTNNKKLWFALAIIFIVQIGIIGWLLR